MSPLELVRYADERLQIVRYRERLSGGSIWIPGYHWFIAQVRSDGRTLWFMGGQN